MRRIMIAQDDRQNVIRRRLDGLERVVVVVLFAFLAYRFAPSVGSHPFNIVYLVAELIVMLMVLFRRSTDQISVAPRDWAIGFAGTFASMMMVPEQPVAALSGIAQAVLTTGLIVSVAAKLQLGRSFGLIAANRGLKTTGVYGLVRHPMYLGYFFVQAGALMLNFSVWNVVVLLVWAGMQILRMNAEERVLGGDPVYAAHMERVRYRLIPYAY